MAARQLSFDWTPTLADRARLIGYDELRGYVQILRLAGVSKLRELKQIVEAAIAEDDPITDDDIPF